MSDTQERSRHMRAVRVFVAAALGVALATALPGVARAGQFVIASCQADQNNYSTLAFNGSFVTRGMEIKPQCSPEGVGRRGLLTQNQVRNGTVPYGSVARVSIAAPPGSSFTLLRWGGTLRRSDCRYSLQLWAEGPAIQKVPIRNLRANHDCKPRAQAAGYPTRLYKVAGATRIVQRAICMGGKGTRVCSTRGPNYIRTFKAKVWVIDNTPPSVSILPDTPLARGAWVSGNQPLNYVAQDNVGVRQANAIGGPRGVGTDFRTCALATNDGAFADGTPCPNGEGQIGVLTRELAEGTQPLSVRAQDSAGNTADSAPVVVRVDNTPPLRVDVGLLGGDRWRNTNDFSLVWSNPPEGDRAPIAAALYKLCPAVAGACTEATQAGAGIAELRISVPSPGEWTLAMWRQDAAGNADSAAASVPLHLRYDPEPPEVAFEPLSATDPTLVSAQATDRVSGLAGGVIEISQAGSGLWQTLSTQVAGSRLLARIDDAALPPGNYLLRATVHDQAGNEASTSQRLDGQPMAVTLPLRIATTMRVGIARARVVHRTVKRHGKRRTIRRRVIVMHPSGVVRIGHRVRVSGQLTNRTGQGIAGADVQVLASSSVAPERLVAVVHTGSSGRFRYLARGSTSRVLRFAYAGSPITLPAESRVSLTVPATSTLQVSRRRVLNGQRVMFSGRVRGLPLPPGGKLIQLEVRLPGRWQTFRTARTDQAGRWAVRYRFTRTRGLQRYRFRVALPAEAGYPFASGASKSVVVRVRGQ